MNEKHFLIRVKDNVKRNIKENSTKISLAAAGVATLGATYLLGKDHGKQSFVADIYLTPVDENGTPTASMDLPLVK